MLQCGCEYVENIGHPCPCLCDSLVNIYRHLWAILSCWDTFNSKIILEFFSYLFTYTYLAVVLYVVYLPYAEQQQYGFNMEFETGDHYILQANMSKYYGLLP